MEEKLKRRIFRMVILLLLIGTFVTIFRFSSQNGTDSKTLSMKVARKIVNAFPYTKNLNENTKEKMVERSQPIIRKMAHFSIYTAVGILIMAFVSTYDMYLLKKFMISLFVGLIYAISDEIHQSLIPGRDARIFDVCIDTTGVFSGIIIILIVISVYKALFKEVRE